MPDIDRLYNDYCGYCGMQHQGKFTEVSYRLQIQDVCFNEYTQYEWGDQNHLDDEYIRAWECSECNETVPPDLEAIIAIYRGSITLYNKPEPRT